MPGGSTEGGVELPFWQGKRKFDVIFVKLKIFNPDTFSKLDSTYKDDVGVYITITMLILVIVWYKNESSNRQMFQGLSLIFCQSEVDQNNSCHQSRVHSRW